MALFLKVMTANDLAEKMKILAADKNKLKAMGSCLCGNNQRTGRITKFAKP